MTDDVLKLKIFEQVAVSVDKYAYSRPSNIAYPNSDDLAQEGKLAAWTIIQRWPNKNFEHMRRSSITRGIGAMKDLLRKANLVGPVIHNGKENNAPTSLDADHSDKVVSKDKDDEVTLYDMLPCTDATPVESAMNREMMDIRMALLEVIDTLEEPWRYVIFTRYYQKERLKTVAKALGISDTRVCQLEKQAIENLKDAVKEAGLLWMA